MIVASSPKFILAPIEMESLLKAKPIFSWQERATKGSSFLALEKKALLKKLGMKSGIGF